MGKEVCVIGVGSIEKPVMANRLSSMGHCAIIRDNTVDITMAMLAMLIDNVMSGSERLYIVGLPTVASYAIANKLRSWSRGRIINCKKLDYIS